MPDSVAPGLMIDGLTVHYGATRAVDDVSLSVPQGSILAIVGPSGCGKTTVLRAIAGLGPAHEGRISILGRDVTGLTPEKRHVGLVPQHYGLLPHLSVRDNVEYGLRARKVPTATRRAKAARLLELTRLSQHAARRPAELSGGQRQRVALARALAIDPDLLLLDEPLAALDPQLRETIRQELMALVRQSQVTTVIVTHDQREALAVADRVAVLRAGTVVQDGPVAELWEAPKDDFVADFLAGALLFDARREGDDVVLAEGWRVPVEMLQRGEPRGALRVLARPHQLSLSPTPTPATVPVAVQAVEYAGDEWRTFVRLDGRQIRVDLTVDPPTPGTTAHLGLVPGGARLIGETHA